MKKVKLVAQQRKVFGRKVKKLRQEGVLPANIYGKNIKSQAVQVNLKDFLEVFKQVGETGIVEISLDKETKTRPALIHSLQRHAVTDQPLHVELRQITLTERVQVAIPIELIGEAPAVDKGGVLVQLLNEIEVEALPTDLLEKFVVDVSGLGEIGQSIAIKDLKVDKAKVKILVEDESQLVVKIEEPAKEEVEEKPTEEVEEAAAEEKPAVAETEAGKPPEEAKPEPDAAKAMPGKEGKPEKGKPKEGKEVKPEEGQKPSAPKEKPSEEKRKKQN